MRRLRRRMAKRGALKTHFVWGAALSGVGKESGKLKAAAPADEGARKMLCGAKRMTSSFRRRALGDCAQVWRLSTSPPYPLTSLNAAVLMILLPSCFLPLSGTHGCAHERSGFAGPLISAASPPFPQRSAAYALTRAFPHPDIFRDAARRAAFGFAECCRRRLRRRPCPAAREAGSRGAARLTYCAVSSSISKVIRVFSPISTMLFSVDSSTAKLSFSQKKYDLLLSKKIFAPLSSDMQ